VTQSNDHQPITGSSSAGTVARATRLWMAGRAAQAEKLCQRALTADPANAEALNLLGILAADGGNLADAVDRLEAAVAARPTYTEARVNLARVHLQAERADLAAVVLDPVLSAGEPVPDALNVLGLVHRSQGRPGEALDAFRRAVDARPDYVEALSNLAAATLEHGDLSSAGRHFERLIDLRPDDTDIRTAQATVLWRQGDAVLAMEQFGHVLNVRPDDATACVGLARCLRTLAPMGYDPAIEGALLICFASPDVRHQDLARLSAAVLKLKHTVVPIADADEALAQALILARDPLFAAMMAQTVNVDRDLELLLNGVRRELLLSDEFPIAEDRSRLSGLIAIQGFNNAYATWFDEEESVALAALEIRLRDAGDFVTTPDEAQQGKILAVALYKPLAEFDIADALARVPAAAWSPVLAPVIERTLTEVRQETVIADATSSFRTIDDDVSNAVRAQYEESPYPRWLSAERQPPLDLARRMAGMFPGRTIEAMPMEPLDVLVAGCGTGLQLIHYASAGPADRILAVDLSRRSLAYGQRMAKRYGVDGIEFMQADLLALDGLERTFDLIIATGVLHHMADPERGWSVLTGLLRPGGIINVALYGDRPRATTTEARARIQNLGLSAAPDDIRAFRKAVMTGHDMVSIAVRTRWQDFYDLDGCRDMFFHVHEQQYSVADLGPMMARQGLEFLGFDFENPAAVETYRREYPADPAMTDMDNWTAFDEAYPDTFIGMYSMWCRKPAP